MDDRNDDGRRPQSAPAWVVTIAILTIVAALWIVAAVNDGAWSDSAGDDGVARAAAFLHAPAGGGARLREGPPTAWVTRLTPRGHAAEVAV